MKEIIDFIVNYGIYIVIALVLIALTVVAVIFIKKAKKKKAEEFDAEYQKILESVPIVSAKAKETPQVGGADIKITGEAEYAWLKGKGDTDMNKRTDKENKQSKKTVSGRWVVKQKSQDEFVAFLYANNGEIMLTSETYSTFSGAKKGIETIKKNCLKENFLIGCDKNGRYYFKLKNSKNRFLCVGETYITKDNCENAVNSVMRFIDSDVSNGLEKDLTQIAYVPTNVEQNANAKYKGKWVIEQINGMYMAKLYASNGELLLNSESYTAYSSAKDSIETITLNGLSGNFIIDNDKNGKFFFKLRNAQKTTLCIGETYSQLSACQSAIESVRRFLKTANLTEDENK